ncbi:MAG: hypothetical protein ACJ0SL_04360 [Candidatus Rariloculaceae bacterium]
MGMFEHVGHKNYQGLHGTVVRRCLELDGTISAAHDRLASLLRRARIPG